MKEFLNDKGFLVLEVSRERMLDRLSIYGCQGICDGCLSSPEIGYYVAVLNMWLCKECFDEWYARSERYAEDIRIEERNFERYKSLLK